MKNRGGGEFASRNAFSRSWVLLLCLGSFCAGMFFTNRFLSLNLSWVWIPFIPLALNHEFPSFVY